MCDTGDSLFATVDIRADVCIGPAYYATMGFAIPGSMGLQAASGLRPLVLVGDGAFQMMGPEISQCPRYGLNPIVVLLNNKNRKIREVKISEGSLTASLVHPREVYNPVIRESAAAVIFVHNRPSGDPAPSQEDIEITRRLKEVGEVMGIRVLDHVVIGLERYYSFSDRGIL